MKKDDRIRRLLGVLLVLSLAFFVLPMAASAAGRSPMYPCILANSDEDSVVGLGVPIDLGDFNIVVMSSVVQDREATEFAYAVMTYEESSGYDMKLTAAEPATVIYEISDAEEIPFNQLAIPVIGEEYSLIYLGENDVETCGVVVLGYDDSYDSELFIKYEFDITKDEITVFGYPGVLMDSNGYLLGILAKDSRSDEIVLLGFDIPETTAASGGSGSSGEKDDGFRFSDIAPFVIGGAVGLVIFLIIKATGKKNKEKEGEQSVPSYPENEPYFPPTEPISPTAPAVDSSAPVEPKTLYLACIDGPLTGLYYPIDGTPILVGRAKEAQIQYPADTKGVSRQHCRVSIQNGTLSVMDLGSSSGTFLARRGQLPPNTPTPLVSGDIIYLGSKKVALQVQEK